MNLDTEIVDLRDPISFAGGHIKDSINIPFSPAFFHWAGLILKPSKKRIFVITEHVTEDQLLKAFMNFELDCGYTFLKQNDLKNSELDTLKLFNAAELDVTKQNILDVRTPDEINQSFIKGSQAVELPRLPSNYQEIYQRLENKNLPLAIICASGVRSSIAASFLKRAGIENVGSVRGGMNHYNSL